MNVRTSRILTLTASLVFAQTVFAEPVKEGFFGKDFAKSTNFGQTDNANGSSPGQGKGIQGGGAVSGQQATGAGAPGPQYTPASVEVYISSDDRQHFEDMLVKAFLLVAEGRVRITRITHIGNYKNISADAKALLRFARFPFTPAKAPPKELDTHLSPTWVMDSKEGKVVIEGVVNVEKYIGDDGNFATPVPTVKPTTPPDAIAGF